MKLTGRGQFAVGFLLDLQIGGLRAGEDVFVMVQLDLLVLGECAVFILGLETIDGVEHLAAVFHRHDRAG